FGPRLEARRRPLCQRAGDGTRVARVSLRRAGLAATDLLRPDDGQARLSVLATSSRQATSVCAEPRPGAVPRSDSGTGPAPTGGARPVEPVSGTDARERIRYPRHHAADPA